MDEKDRINDFLQRWSIVIPEPRLFSEFHVRVAKVIQEFLVEVDRIDWRSLRYPLEQRFADYNGSVFSLQVRQNPEISIRTFVSSARDIRGFILVLQRLFWAIEAVRAPEPKQTMWNGVIESLVSKLNQSIERSPGINLRKLQISKGQIDLYPEGIKMLDDKVDENAEWLKTYPDAAREFSNALRIATIKDTKQYRQALDSLRFALEHLLKIILGNKAPLEKQKEHLLKWMKDRDVHTQIRQTYSTVLTQFCNYQNVAVKHLDQPEADQIKFFSSDELEYFIYLTTTLMRFILQVHRAVDS